MRTYSILIFFIALWGFSFAQEDFNYRRKINGVASEDWHSIKLPPEIFHRLKPGFPDIRLFSLSENDTTEIPYILNIRTNKIKEKVVEVPVINKSKKDGKLFLTFKLPEGQEVNYFDLRFEEQNFFAFITIEGSHNQQEWYEITNKQRLLSIHNSATDYQVSIVSFPTSDFRYLRISAESDIPLTFSSASFKDQQITQGVFNAIPVTYTTQQDKKEKRTIIDLTLQHAVPISDFSIEIDSDMDYYRHFELAYVNDSVKTPKGWAKTYSSFYDGYLTSYNPNKFAASYIVSKEFRITIDNRNNAPLTIKGITFSGPLVELTARIKPQEVFVYYGNDQIAFPSYDLSFFADKIPESTQPAALGEEQNIAQVKESRSPLFENKAWLWAVMLLIIGLLGFFTLRMMKRR